MTVGSAIQTVPQTRVEYTLGADVTVTTSYTDGPSGTPAAGTYDVVAYVTVAAGSTSTQPFAGRLLYGATIMDERDNGGTISPAGGGNPCVIALTARITADGSTAVKVQAIAGVNNGTMKRDSVWGGGTSHRATIIVLTRVPTPS